MNAQRRLMVCATAILVGIAGQAEAQGRGGQGNEKPRAEARSQSNASQKPQQAQRNSGGQNQKPQQAQRNSGGQNQKPQQAQRNSGGQNQKPQQAQRNSGGQNQKPQQAQRNSGGQSQKPQQAQRNSAGQNRNAPAAAPGRSGNAASAPGQVRRDEVASRWAAASARPARLVSRPVRMEKLPERFRTLSRENRPAATALAAALALGHDYNSMPVHYVAVGDGYRVLNLRDDVLVDLRDDDLRRLGYWDIRRLDPRGVRDGAPAFCRNGNGHPVWGREWCIDKGFGLGASNGWLWGRHRPDDVVFMRIGDNSRVDRRSLLDVLGSVVFNRLAVHSLTLGLTDPLAGQWIGEPTGPRVLMLNSGNVQVAELVDWDRDGTVDVMYVVSR